MSKYFNLYNAITNLGKWNYDDVSLVENNSIYLNIAKRFHINSDILQIVIYLLESGMKPEYIEQLVTYLQESCIRPE